MTAYWRLSPSQGYASLDAAIAGATKLTAGDLPAAAIFAETGGTFSAWSLRSAAVAPAKHVVHEVEEPTRFTDHHLRPAGSTGNATLHPLLIGRDVQAIVDGARVLTRAAPDQPG